MIHIYLLFFYVVTLIIKVFNANYFQQTNKTIYITKGKKRSVWWIETNNATFSFLFVLIVFFWLQLNNKNMLAGKNPNRQHHATAERRLSNER